MKKSLLSSLFVSVMLMTSGICKADIAQNIAGNYKGEVVVNLGEGDGDPILDQKVSIVVEDNNTIQFTLFGFNFAPVINNEDIVLDGVPVKEEADGLLTIGDDAYSKELALGGGVVQATVKFDSQNSYIDGDDIKVSLNIMWQGISFKVYFTGKKDATGIISNSVNSASSKVTFDVNTNLLTASDMNASGYEIYSIEGKLMKNGMFANGTASVDGLAKGLYLVKTGNATTKFIKK